MSVLFPLPGAAPEEGRDLLEEFAAALRGELPRSEARLAGATGSAGRHLVLEVEGRPVCTVRAVAARDPAKVKVTLSGDEEEVVMCARWFRDEQVGQDAEVCFQRGEPFPWEGWRKLPHDDRLFRERLLGDEPPLAW
ncbi:hypothetical protein ACPCA8_04920 [Streptomyces capoamus]|uniref:hypothetical protein n=1 Tax=Streptomyces capoamus TaxID=68183 RepID=UPI003C2CAC26